MMNLFQLQEQLKDFSKEQLLKEMQAPSGNAPPFLVMTELQRRTRMENAAALDKGPPTSTVAQDTVNAAGVPQGGIADMARSLAPQTDMTQNTGAMPAQGAAPVQAMQEGGLAGISRDVRDYRAESDPAIVTMAGRFGMTPTEYLASLDPEARAQNMRRLERNRMLALEPVGDGATFPTQEDLDRRFREAPVTSEMLTERGLARGGVNPSYVESTAIPTYLEEPRTNRTMSGGPTLQLPADTVAAFSMPRGAPATAEEYQRTLDSLINGPSARPVPEKIAAIGPPDAPVDVRTAPAATPPAPVDEFLSALPMGDLTEGLRPRTERAIDAALDRRMNADANVGSISPQVMNPEQRAAFETLTPEQQSNVLLYGVPDVSTDRTVVQGDTAISDIGREARDLYESQRDAMPMTTGAGLEMPDGGAGELLPPEVLSPPEILTAPEQPAGTAAPSGGGMPSLVAAAPPPQTDQDRMLEQDKWLALARFGAALASSQAPTFGQALGQATQVGLDALGQARQDYLERKKTADDMAMARATLAARMAGSGGDSRPRAIPVGAAGIFDDQIASLQQQLLMAETPDEELRLRDQLRGLENMRSALAMQFASQYLPGVGMLAAPAAPEAPPVDVSGGDSVWDRLFG